MNSYIAVDPMAADTLLLELVRKPAGVAETLRAANAIDVARLQLVGAVNGDSLTPLAAKLAPLVHEGVPAHLARILLAARDLGCLKDAVKLVALLRPGRTIRFRPPEPGHSDQTGQQNCVNADKAHAALARTGYKTDLGRLLGMYDAVVALQRSGGVGSVAEFCQQNYVAANIFGEANRTHQGLLRLLERAGIKTASSEAPADEKTLIFALLHGLADMVVESEARDRSGGSARGSWVYSRRMEEGGWLIAPGSTLRECNEDVVILPLFLLRGTSRSGRSYTGHSTGGRPFVLITEAVEVGQEVLNLVESAGLMKVHRNGHNHTKWRKDDRVVCRETWYAGGNCLFDRTADAPAGPQTARAFAESLTCYDLACYDPDGFRDERRPLDPVVVAARQMHRLTGGKFPDFCDQRVNAALARKLLAVDTWSAVQAMDAAGQLVIGWEDVAAICGMELATLQALRASIEQTCPALVTVNGADVTVQYRQQDGGEVAVLELPFNSPALAGLAKQHLPEALHGRTVQVVVTGIGNSSRFFYRHTKLTGNFDDLDGLRRRVALAVNKPSAAELPGKVGELVRPLTVNHPDRVETLYLVSGSPEPFTDLALARAAALVLVEQWLDSQARAAAAPHELEPELLAASREEGGRFGELPTDVAVLERSAQVVQKHVTTSVKRRVARRAELLAALTTLGRHGAKHGQVFATVEGRQTAALALLRSAAGNDVLLGDSLLEQAATEMAAVGSALPVITDDGARSLELSARVESLSKDVKKVRGTDFRTERRSALARVSALVAAQKLDEADSALAVAEKLFTETADLDAKGQTRRLRGGQ